MKVVKSFVVISCLAAILLSFSGCGTYSDGFQDRLTVTKKQGLTRWESYERSLSPKPEDAIPQIRIFATQNIESLSDNEVDFINNNNPEIQYNELNMEYSFYWRFDKKEILEVVTSPPPCKPFAAYRTSRVYFP